MSFQDEIEKGTFDKFIIPDESLCVCDVSYLLSDEYFRQNGEYWGLIINEDGTYVCEYCDKRVTESKYTRIKKMIKLNVAKEIVAMHERDEYVPKDKLQAAQSAIPILEEDLKNV